MQITTISDMYAAIDNCTEIKVAHRTGESESWASISKLEARVVFTAVRIDATPEECGFSQSFGEVKDGILYL